MRRGLHYTTGPAPLMIMMHETVDEHLSSLLRHLTESKSRFIRERGVCAGVTGNGWQMGSGFTWSIDTLTLY